jgi:hypothetical protein
MCWAGALDGKRWRAGADGGVAAAAAMAAAAATAAGGGVVAAAIAAAIAAGGGAAVAATVAADGSRAATAAAGAATAAAAAATAAAAAATAAVGVEGYEAADTAAAACLCRAPRCRGGTLWRRWLTAAALHRDGGRKAGRREGGGVVVCGDARLCMCVCRSLCHGLCHTDTGCVNSLAQIVESDVEIDEMDSAMSGRSGGSRCIIALNF